MWLIGLLYLEFTVRSCVGDFWFDYTAMWLIDLRDLVLQYIASF